MKELIECKDLRHNERVRMAYWSFIKPDGTWQRPPNMPGISLAEMAFEMRDASDNNAWLRGLYKVAVSTGTGLYNASPKHWIIAATLAWEAKK